jgi:integrase
MDCLSCDSVEPMWNLNQASRVFRPMPVVRLTSRFVETATLPQSGVAEYWDDTLPGFGLRIWSGGSKAWTILYRVGGGRSGHKRRLTIGRFPSMSLADARLDAKRRLADISRGEDPALDRSESRLAETVAVFANKYVQSLQSKERKTWASTEQRFQNDVLPIIGKMKPCDVRKVHIRAVIEKIVARGSKGQANRVFDDIHAMFSWIARDYDDVLESPPTYAMRRPFATNARQRLLSASEVQIIWHLTTEKQAAHGKSRMGNDYVQERRIVSPGIELVLKLLLLTGQRSSEVSQALQSEFNLLEQVWTIPAERSKNGREHRVPLSSQAICIVRRAYELASHSSSLFPAPFKRKFQNSDDAITHTSPNHALRRILNHRGMDAACVHDFRRFVASGISELGFPNEVIAAVLNHSPQGVTARHYNMHKFESEKRAALMAWSQRLDEIVGAHSIDNNN